MDPKQRNAAALHRRVDRLLEDISSHFYAVFTLTALDETSDYSQTANKELSIKQEALSIATMAEDFVVLIRNLQELWLFGGLDTITDPADAAADKAKALEVARLIENLAKKAPFPQLQVRNGVESGNKEGEEAPERDTDEMMESTGFDMEVPNGRVNTVTAGERDMSPHLSSRTVTPGSSGDD